MEIEQLEAPSLVEGTGKRHSLGRESLKLRV